MDPTVIASVLIANRGEIARRIIRTARRLGISTVAVFSEADAAASHVKEADFAVAIGPAPARESYLRGDAVVAAALASGAEAIHPGFGFLSENADFAEQVIAAGLVWIGPPPAAIRAMGPKDAAKKMMAEAGVPVTPGYLGEDQSPATLAREAAAIGWPVLIKAVAGGGGKGMRKVEAAADFEEALSSARREALSAFGDEKVLLEKYVSRPRHIEVQVFADAEGHVVHMFERDCSIQRRHQKVIEEAPAPGMKAATREALCASAVRAARAVGYQGAGTVEFIADASDGLRADRIWFMEMNTRLQVEHPVTEAITGLDLVEWQFLVASGEPLPLTQDQITMSGHAIEARLYAEDPANGFLPSVGTLSTFHVPDDVRVDASVVEGDTVSPHYDPMLAKLICHRPTRREAAGDLAAACASVRAWPVRTNAWLLARSLTDPDFLQGDIDTGFVEQRAVTLASRPMADSRIHAAGAAALALAQASGGRERDPWDGGLSCFRVNETAASPMRMYEDGQPIDLMLTSLGADGDEMSASVDGAPVRVSRSRGGELLVGGRAYWTAVGANGEEVVFDGGAAFAFNLAAPGAAREAGGGDGVLRTPMPGRIVAVAVRVGDSVKSEASLVTLEAMKMEHALKAPFDGVVIEVTAKEGDQVAEGVVVVRLEPAA
jgi:acetyl/propionyl-CoA carboxylase alpha subunit